MKSMKTELVRHFFEDGDYYNAAEPICEPDMGPAIEAYLLERYCHQRDFAALDFTRLILCFNINASAVLKELLFRGLDLWAENGFDPDTQIGGTMENYIAGVFGNLKDKHFPNEYTGLRGLLHVELLRQYLNRCYKNEQTSALWDSDFPEIFKVKSRRPPFAVVFLLMMLDEKQEKTASFTMLDTGPLSMLVRCGYEYLFHDDFAFYDAVSATIRYAVAEIAIQNKFYLRGDHRQLFPGFADNLLYNAVHAEIFRIIGLADQTLRDIFFGRIEFLITPGNGQSLDDLRDLAMLIAKMPRECIADREPAWQRILAVAKRVK